MGGGGGGGGEEGAQPVDCQRAYRPGPNRAAGLTCSGGPARPGPLEMPIQDNKKKLYKRRIKESQEKKIPGRRVVPRTKPSLKLKLPPKLGLSPKIAPELRFFFFFFCGAMVSIFPHSFSFSPSPFFLFSSFLFLSFLLLPLSFSFFFSASSLSSFSPSSSPHFLFSFSSTVQLSHLSLWIFSYL